ENGSEQMMRNGPKSVSSSSGKQKAERPENAPPPCRSMIARSGDQLIQRVDQALPHTLTTVTKRLALEILHVRIQQPVQHIGLVVNIARNADPLHQATDRLPPP